MSRAQPYARHLNRFANRKNTVTRGHVGCTECRVPPPYSRCPLLTSVCSQFFKCLAHASALDWKLLEPGIVTDHGVIGVKHFLTVNTLICCSSLRPNPTLCRRFAPRDSEFLCHLFISGIGFNLKVSCGFLLLLALALAPAGMRRGPDDTRVA